MMADQDLTMTQRTSTAERAVQASGAAALTSRPTSRGPLEAETLPTRLGETPLERELLEDVKRL